MNTTTGRNWMSNFRFWISTVTMNCRTKYLDQILRWRVMKWCLTALYIVWHACMAHIWWHHIAALKLTFPWHSLLLSQRQALELQVLVRSTLEVEVGTCTFLWATDHDPLWARPCAHVPASISFQQCLGWWCPMMGGRGGYSYHTQTQTCSLHCCLLFAKAPQAEWTGLLLPNCLRIWKVYIIYF